MLAHYSGADIALIPAASALPPPPAPAPAEASSASSVSAAARLLLAAAPPPPPPGQRRRPWKPRTFSDPGPWAPVRDGARAAAVIAAAASAAGARDGSWSDVSQASASYSQASASDASRASASDSGVFVDATVPPAPREPPLSFHDNPAFEPEGPGPPRLSAVCEARPAEAQAHRRPPDGPAGDMEIRLDPLALPALGPRVAAAGPQWGGWPGQAPAAAAFEVPVVTESFLKRTCHERFFKKICSVIIVIVFSGVVAMVVVPYIMAKK